MDNSEYKYGEANTDELNNYIKNLTYEVHMFCRLAIVLSSYEKIELSIANEKDTTVKNENEDIKSALLESFLVHSRIIVSFLSKCPRYDKNYEIFINNREKPFLDDNDDIARLIKNNANPEIMHFTDRKTKTEWDVQNIACHIAEKIKNFVNEAKTDLSVIKKEIDDLETSLCGNRVTKKPPSSTTEVRTYSIISVPSYSLRNVIFQNTAFEVNMLYAITGVSKPPYFVNVNLSNTAEFILYPTSEVMAVTIELVNAVFLASPVSQPLSATP